MDKKIESIGTLNGKILLFGGVYSNLQALEAIYSIAQSEKIAPQNCICTGDAVGYCASPEETISFLESWNPHCIAGNVEIQLAQQALDCGCDFAAGSRCDGFSQLWYPYAQSQLSKQSLAYIKKRPPFISFEYANKKVTVLHGSYINTSEFIFYSTPWEKKQVNFDKTKSDVIIAGHCGLPFSQEKSGAIWLNPGVIGMPANDAETSVWYMILDDKNDKFAFEHKKLVYNHQKAHNDMVNKKLPLEYAKTLLTGIWDNTEILPCQEAKQQGKQIEFEQKNN